MTTKPVLMSGPMVRAILDGRKTQTRRVIKPRRDGGVITGPAAQSGGAIEAWGGGARHIPSQMEVQSCPYGQPGDMLWLKETHYVWSAGCVRDNGLIHDTRIDYRATEPDSPCGGWTPSIFMPRCASRITLRITDVRVERVQEITLGDVRAEGIDAAAWQKGDTEFAMFADLWDSLNAKRGHPWSANPWVWVVEFQPILENVDDVLAREAA